LKCEFVTSAIDAAGFPRERLPEVALVGRSNVGKSSVINALVRATVARTSAAPGKTRLANFYRVVPDGGPPFYLVDLPGYGYARGGDSARREFDAIVGAYFGSDRQPKGDHVRGVLHLVDSRHPDLESDRHAGDWLQRLAVPYVVVATKVDKLTRRERDSNVRVLEQVHEGPVLGTSAHTGEGMKELWKTIDALLQPQPPPPAARPRARAQTAAAPNPHPRPRR
jgi:GTP-binding protein